MRLLYTEKAGFVIIKAQVIEQGKEKIVEGVLLFLDSKKNAAPTR